MYDTLLARSFSKHDQRKLGFGALLTSLFIAFSFCAIFKHYVGPLPVLNLQFSIGADQNLQVVNDTSGSLLVAKEIVTEKSEVINDSSSSHQIVKESPTIEKVFANGTISSQQGAGDDAKVTTKAMGTSNDTKEPRQMSIDAVIKNKIGPICSFLGRSEFCEIKGDIRIDGNYSTVFSVSSQADTLAAENTSWSVRPYARKEDQFAMNKVREWSVKLVADGHNISQCTHNHRVPAILFSLGGYSGNHFHAFTEIIVPLFATARPFDGEVQFLITDKQSRWIAKFQILLKALSRYEIIDIDKGEDIHCFSSITVGLKGRPNNKELSIDPTTSSYTIKDFREFLRSSYSLKKINAIKIRDGERKRPRLLIISRKWSRAFTNAGEIAKMARRLNYKVLIAEPEADVARFAQTMNSCDVLLGVHGAGLTNMVFLPEKAVFIQVVPFGGAEWLSRTAFEEPAKDMSLRYLNYNIRREESTLMQQYPIDHVVLRDPSVIQKQGWEAFKSTYLDKQNVKLDVNRFKPTLSKALELLHQ